VGTIAERLVRAKAVIVLKPKGSALRSRRPSNGGDVVVHKDLVRRGETSRNANTTPISLRAGGLYPVYSKAISMYNSLV
jgi:hypothetical protein